MSDTKIIVFPRGQLTPKDKERLTKNGIVAVEADDPGAVRQLQLTEPLCLRAGNVTGDAILHAALAAIAGQPPENDSRYITLVGRAAHEFVRMLAMSTAPKKDAT